MTPASITCLRLLSLKMDKNIQAVLFDLDGTLIDSAPDLGAAADKMRVSRGLPSLDQAQYRPMAGAGARGMLGVAFDITPEHADFEALREEFFRNYEACMTERTYAFDGVAQMLFKLGQAQLKWGIVTNKSKRFTDPLVRAMPVLVDAQVVISGDTTAHAKPHPEPLLEAARRIGVAPVHCVYVGDDKRDIDAARAAGMHSLAAAYGYLGVHDISSWGADAVLQQPQDLIDWLNGAAQQVPSAL